MQRRKQIPAPTRFGQNLRYLRILSGLSQNSLGLSVGLNRNRIASYEQGVVEPSAYNLLSICVFFNQSAEDILEIDMSHVSDQSAAKLSTSQEVAPDMVHTMNSFLLKTLEMQKILQGFKAFYDLRDSAASSAEPLRSHPLYLKIVDLLAIFESAITANLDLIHSIIPPADLTED